MIAIDHQRGDCCHVRLGKPRQGSICPSRRGLEARGNYMHHRGIARRQTADKTIQQVGALWRLDEFDFTAELIGIVVRLIQNDDHLALLGLVLQHRDKCVFKTFQIARQGHDDREPLHRSTFQGAFFGLCRQVGQNKFIQYA